jgi:hypothetical protein
MGLVVRVVDFEVRDLEVGEGGLALTESWPCVAPTLRGEAAGAAGAVATAQYQLEEIAATGARAVEPPTAPAKRTVPGPLTSESPTPPSTIRTAIVARIEPRRPP